MVLATVGMHFAYMPLLVLLLPRRIDVIAGADATAVLSWVVLIGAVTASIANIVAGYVGDYCVKIFKSRRYLIAAGITALVLSYLPLLLADDFGSLVAAIFFFQASLNFAFSPIMALLADHIPTAQKGQVAGWMGSAMPLSAIGTFLLGMLFTTDSNFAFFVTAAVIALSTAPLVIFWGFGPASAPQPIEKYSADEHRLPESGVLALLWCARLIIQMSASFLVYYLFFQISDLIETESAWRGQDPSGLVALFSLGSACFAIPAAIIAGRASDGSRCRQTMMISIVFGLALSFFALASQPLPILFGAAFIAFQLGLSAYLAIDSALVAGLASPHPKRGMILGAMNLANTLPAILAPIIALQILHPDDGTMAYQAIYTVCGTALLMAAFAVYLSKGYLGRFNRPR